MKVKCVTKQHYNEVAYMFGTDPHKCHIMMLIVEWIISRLQLFNHIVQPSANK